MHVPHQGVPDYHSFITMTMDMTGRFHNNIQQVLIKCQIEICSNLKRGCEDIGR